MASPLWLLMTPCFLVGLWDAHRVSCGCGKPGCQESFNPEWEMRPGLKWGEVGLSLGWGPWGTWQPSPCEALSLAFCQVPAPPPLLNHCHLSSEQGDQAVGFSFPLRILETE